MYQKPALQFRTLSLYLSKRNSYQEHKPSLSPSKCSSLAEENKVPHQAHWPLPAHMLARGFGCFPPLSSLHPLHIHSLVDPWSSHEYISLFPQGRSNPFSLFSAVKMGLTSPCTAAHTQLQTPQGRHIISNCEQMLLVFINLQTLYLPISPTFLSHSLSAPRQVSASIFSSSVAVKLNGIGLIAENQREGW